MIDFAGIRERGGLAYGLSLAEDAARGLPIQIAPWTFLPLAELRPESVHAISARMGSLVLRWSAAGPDEFTSRARRGDKPRQINAIGASQPIEQVAKEIHAATLAMPTAATGAVLQQALGLSNGCLFDLEVTGHGIDVEFRTATARLLVGRNAGPTQVEQIGEDFRLPGLSETASVIDHMTAMVTRLPLSESGWHFEGALTPSPAAIWILQLRPTPTDRPTADRIGNIPEAWDSTRYVWGVFDVEVDLDNNRATLSDGSLAHLSIREYPQCSLERPVQETLKAGGRALVLNHVSGFRLTHEPFNLPAAIARDHFYSVHLRTSCNRRFRVASDGDTAYFLEWR